MIRDPQNVITQVGNKFRVEGRDVVFYYHHDSKGRMRQCDAFCKYQLPDGTPYLVMSYSRPHVLDKSKVSKLAGRTIAAARLAKFLRLADNGEVTKIQNMKGIRIYSEGVTRIFILEDEKGEPYSYVGRDWKLESYRTTLEKADGTKSAARCEKITALALSRINDKL